MSGDVHCWCVKLDMPPARCARLYATLADDERERSERLRSERDRRRFIVARGALRDVLARYVDTEPDQIRFAYNAFGKPELGPDIGSPGRLRFNLSHSADLALIAVAADADVGVDLENVRDAAGGTNYAEIARCFFSAAEFAQLKTVPSHLQVEAFLDGWTMREAYVKARGEGLGDDPVEFDSRWSFFSLRPAPGYIGAVAVEGTGWTTSLLRYDVHSLQLDGRRRHY